VLISNALSIN
jgi:endothelin-converting enzyme